MSFTSAPAIQIHLKASLVVLPTFRSTEPAYGYERSLYGEAYTTTKEWEDRASVSERGLRYVTRGDKAMAQDILSLRNSLLDLIKRLRAQGFDLEYLHMAEQVLKQVTIESGSIMYANTRNAISQALVYICIAITKRLLLRLDTGTITETATLTRS